MKNRRAYRPPNLAPPIQFSWEALSGFSRVALEIGAGLGLHAIDFCKRDDKTALIAVERTQNRSAQLLRRAAQHPNLTNLFPVRADAVFFLDQRVPDAALDEIFLLYPNPYPKNKQRNLRWHYAPAMDVILRKLKSGGHLHLATNIKYYADEAEHELVTKRPLQLSRKDVLTDPNLARSHFEKKYLEREEICWNFEFKRISSSL